VKAILPDVPIQREASPSWLGRQRLDIFLPTLNLAIEYQGAQHFSPVSVFGGEAGLVRAQERDALKKRLCEKNGVDILYVLSTDPVTEPAIRRRLGRDVKRQTIFPIETPNDEADRVLASVRDGVPSLIRRCVLP
jgi:hypothetical protein